MMVNKKDLKRYYEKEAKTIQQQSMYGGPAVESHHHVLRKYWISGMISKNDGESFLDAGCAEGMYTIEATNSFSYVIGLDIAVSYILKAKKRARKRNVEGKMDFVMAELEHLPFRERSFSFVFCSEVLEHTLKPKKAIQELTRITNGFVLISTPTIHSSLYGLVRPKRVEELLRKGLGDLSAPRRGHFHDFDSRTLVYQLQAEGLEIKEVRSSAIIGDPLYRYVKKPEFTKISELVYFPVLKVIEKIGGRLPWFRYRGLWTIILGKEGKN